MPRPPLPYHCANPSFKNFSATQLPPVKYQILSCQGKEILVGRLKIDTVKGGHAFILRRFDTDAISLTTMFRAAFPTSSDAEEKAEVAYVKETFDLTGFNGSAKLPEVARLAGTWISPAIALNLAQQYNMVDLIEEMIKALPDPNTQYRRSNKSAQAAGTPPVVSQTPVGSPRVNGTPLKPTTPKPPSKTLPTPSPTAGDANPPAAKRRREESPAMSPSSVPRPASPAPPKTPASRRSTRMKSPAPSRVPQPLTSSKPRSRASVAPPTPQKKAAELPSTYTSSPMKEEDENGVANTVAGSELWEQDIAEQKMLIADLAAKALKSSADKIGMTEEEKQRLGEEVYNVISGGNDHTMREEEEEEEEEQGPSKLKRARQEEEEHLQFDFKEPEVEERQIVTNRRVERTGLQPRTKSLAWGIAAFAVGMSAVSFLPNFF